MVLLIDLGELLLGVQTAGLHLALLLHHQLRLLNLDGGCSFEICRNLFRSLGSLDLLKCQLVLDPLYVSLAFLVQDIPVALHVIARVHLILHGSWVPGFEQGAITAIGIIGTILWLPLVLSSVALLFLMVAHVEVHPGLVVLLEGRSHH